MTVSKPLLKLFDRARKADLPLGVDQYNLAVEALVKSIEDGFNPTDIEALKRLCQTVWVKSPKEKQIFDKCWQELLSASPPSRNSPRQLETVDEDDGKNPQPEEEDTAKDEDINRENDSEITEEYLPLETAEIQVGKAVSVFWRENYYFPVSRAQLREAWQKFQPQNLPTAPTQIDIPATVEKVAKSGFFTKPVLTQPTTLENPPQVLLLIDQQGSMTPFHPFCRHLVKIWDKAQVYYFKNCPTDELYRDPQLRQNPEDLETVLEQFPTKNTVAIIISDAGAAKGRSVPSRWEETVDFLNVLTDEVSRVVWLNPLPRDRGFDSTAEAIAQIYPKQVPMFALEALEWKHMIQWLRWGEKSALRFVEKQENKANEARQPKDLEENWDWEFDALSRINSFKKQYGQAHLDLAYHAAFPLTITPDLLYRLWHEFLVKSKERGASQRSKKNRSGSVSLPRDIIGSETLPLPISENEMLPPPWYTVADFLLSDLCHPIDTELTELYEIDREIRNELLRDIIGSETLPLPISENEMLPPPWYAVADFLLSDLCHPIDTELTELYEIDREIRNELLKQCQDKFGKKRLDELSNFLIDYLDKQIQKPLLPTWLESFYQMQNWAALAYTRKDEAAQKIAESLKQAYLHNDKSELVQWSELVATLTPVLSEYQPLLIAAKGYGAEARGIRKGTEAARQEWEEKYPNKETESVAGIELAKPGSIFGKLPLKTFTFETVTVNKKGKIIQRETKQARYFTEDLGNGVTFDMVYIPGGTFLMGSPETEAETDDDEKPQHQVTIEPFYMGKYAATQAQWKAVAQLPKIERDLDPDPSRFKGDNRPVERVLWRDAVEFCARVSKKTGRNYRLPSEAEWEYACRAHTETPFHFGETITTDLANYDGNDTYLDAPKGKYRKETVDVGSYPPNAFGLYEMHGNVWEWCADPWHGNYKGAPTDGSVWDEEDNDNRYQKSVDLLVMSRNDDRSRLLRGGSWYSLPRSSRSAIRFHIAPDTRSFYIGFRFVCVAAWTK
jgi:formylglycine-generating enzyme required for sulfatase activity/uncharacterized protein with von Willebrand factor type A (vWA) domain